MSFVNPLHKVDQLNKIEKLKYGDIGIGNIGKTIKDGAKATANFVKQGATTDVGRVQATKALDAGKNAAIKTKQLVASQPLNAVKALTNKPKQQLLLEYKPTTPTPSPPLKSRFPNLPRVPQLRLPSPFNRTEKPLLLKDHSDPKQSGDTKSGSQTIAEKLLSKIKRPFLKDHSAPKQPDDKVELEGIASKLLSAFKSKNLFFLKIIPLLNNQTLSRTPKD